MRYLVPVVIAASFGACSGAAPAPSFDTETLPTTIVVKVGESRTFGSSRVRFSEVKGDSRCPVDVVCVWAGNAEIALVVEPTVGEGPAQLLTLNTFLEPHAGNARGLRFTLVGLTPEPRSTDKQRADVATIKVERAE